MRKKLIALLTALTLVVSCAAVFAADAVEIKAESTEAVSLVPIGYEEEAAILSALDVYHLNIDEDFGFNPDESVKTSDFIEAALRMRISNIDAGADIAFLADRYGVIEDYKKVNMNADIKFGDALKILIATLDYKHLAEAKGGWPMGYIKTAREIDIIKDVNYQMNADLTLGEMLTLLAKTIEAPVAQFESYGKSEYSFKNTEGVTVLSEYRDIYRVKGQLKENNLTTLNDVSSLEKDEVKIGEYVYKTGKTNAGEWLGKNIRAYVIDNNDGIKPEILYISDYGCKNQEIVIEAEDIKYLDDSIRSLTYYDENDKEKNVKLSNTRRVIYNDVVYNDFTKEDIMNGTGTIRLLDYTNDKVYDVVFVSHYQTSMLVNYVASYDNIIYSYYKNPVLPRSVELYDENDDDAENIILLNGEQIKITDIKKNDVISVAKTKNPNRKRAKVLVSRNTFQGKIRSYNMGEEEFYLNTDEGTKTLELNKAFAKELEYENHEFGEITAGVEYVFYLDPRGRISGMITEEDAGWQYVVIVAMAKGKGILGGIDVKYLDASGKWHVSTLRDNIKYNNSPRTAESVFTELTGGVNIEPQVASIKLTSDEKIGYLRTAEETNEQSKKKLTKKTMEGRQNFSTKGYRFGENPMYFIDDSATVFVMPSLMSRSEDDYLVSGRGYFRDEGYNDVVFYNLDEYGFTDLVSVKADVDPDTDSQSLFVVTDITQELDENGMIVDKLYGTMGNYTSISAIAKDDTSFSGKLYKDVRKGNNSGETRQIKIGDVVQMSTGLDGRVTKSTIISSVSDGRWSVNDNTVMEPIVCVYSGNVEKIDAENRRLLINRLNDSFPKQNIRLNPGIVVTVYDEQTETVSKVKTSDIQEGDFIIVRTYETSIVEVVVIKFKDE